MASYIISGKLYDTEKAALLCSYIKPGSYQKDKEDLYRSAKGTFFKVSTTEDNTEVSLLSEKSVSQFLDAHPAGIDQDIYRSIFGEPEEG